MSALVCSAAALGQPSTNPNGTPLLPPPGAENSDSPIQPPGGAYLTAPLPQGSPMPSPDPRNLEGTWAHRAPLIFQIRTDMFGAKLPLNAEGKRILDRRLDAMKKGTPFITASAECYPMGPVGQMAIGTPFQIFQTKRAIDFLFEEYHGAYEVALDGAKPAGTAFNGVSSGHWDGDTLVIETTGFNDRLWLDPNGTPASKNATLIQRIRKVRQGDWFLEVTYTLDDPTYYTRPWSWVRDFVWRPDTALFREYNCELQTGRKGGLDSSLVPEPAD